MRDTHTRTQLAALGLLLLIARGDAVATPATLRVGYYTQGAFGEAAERDSTMALSLWGREVTRGLRFPVSPQAVSFPDANRLASATVSG